MMLSFGLLCFAGSLVAQEPLPTSAAEDTEQIMSEAYWKLWNPEEQARIDADIEKNRKSDALIQLKNVRPDTEVEVRQVSNDFIFGAHIFNFNQLGTPDANRKYREVYGTLFNRATVAFYWRTFEMEPNRPRFREEYWDTEEYWNRQADPKRQPHWRRPSSDQVIDYCISRGIPVHGHPMVWGNRKWHDPDWLIDRMMVPEEKAKLDKLIVQYATLQNYKDQDKFSPEYEAMTAKQLADHLPEFAKTLNRLFRKRIRELADYYGDRVSSWDVVNESATDFAAGRMIPGDALCKSTYGIMRGDYTFQSFLTADSLLSDRVALNINDYSTGPEYVAQVKDLLARGARIDILGSQMHLFNPQQCLDIAAGKPIQTPQQVRTVMDRLAQPGLPIHLSEITITSPGEGLRAEKIQAIIARNLYRLWFSLAPMMGITWWNVVDDCGAPGEPSVSGLFHRDMSPKQSFHALNRLINEEWKTRITMRTDRHGTLRFRGFHGKYEITYKDKSGKRRTMQYHLK